MLAIIRLALITIYMIVSALVLAFKGLDQLVKDNKGSFTLGDIFTNAIFRNIMLSLTPTLDTLCVCYLALRELSLLISSFFFLFSDARSSNHDLQLLPSQNTH